VVQNKFGIWVSKIYVASKISSPLSSSEYLVLIPNCFPFIDFALKSGRDLAVNNFFFSQIKPHLKQNMRSYLDLIANQCTFEE